MVPVISLCVFGDFAYGDVRVIAFPPGSHDANTFQDVLTKAGYDCEIHNLDDVDLFWLSPKAPF